MGAAIPNHRTRTVEGHGGSGQTLTTAALSETEYKGVVAVNPWGISCREEKECLFAKQ